MKSLRNIESAGWGTLGIISLLIIGPVTYFTCISLYDTTPVSLKIASGVLISLIAAAIITFAINETLYRIGRKRAEEARKIERRAKKKNKKKKKR